MKRLLLMMSILISITPSCKKDDNKAQPVHMSIPFLTARIWTLDTMTINPPATYSQLSAADQQVYRLALGWNTGGQLTFNEDGTVTCGGDWDFGYSNWRLINNDKYIEVQEGYGNRNKDTLFNWTADSQQFTYQRTMSPAFNCTAIFR